MATRDECATCTRISYFSTGHQLYEGYALGSFGVVDNVSTMAAARWSIANYRNSWFVDWPRLGRACAGHAIISHPFGGLCPLADRARALESGEV